jgi:hypothetical protein
MDWKNNPEAELIIDMAGRLTDGNPSLRDKWIPELLKLLSDAGHRDLTEEIVGAALQAGDALTRGAAVLGTSSQRRSFRTRFPWP